MADFPSWSDLFRIGRDELLARSQRMTLSIIEREGTDANAIVAAIAAVGDAVVGQLVALAASQFLETASGAALRKYAYDKYGLLPKDAAAALGTVQFSTTVPAAAAFTIPAGTQLQTVDGIKFVTTLAATYPAGSVGPVIAKVRSALAGLSQQAKAYTITSIVSVIATAPADLAVTNPAATAGAADEESDASLRNRARHFFTTARKGTIAAIEQGALAVPGVETATAVEQLDALGRPTKYVELLITDAFTDVLLNEAVTPPTYAAQSNVLAQSVYNSLYDVRAAGIYVDVRVASIVTLAVKLQLAFVAGVDVDAVAYAARAAIVNYVNSLKSGSPFQVNAAYDALAVVPGLVVTKAEILSPPGDVIPKKLEALRTTMGLVSADSAQPQNKLSPSAVV